MQPFDVYSLFNIAIVRGEGCHVWDADGNEYLDLYGGHAVISVGHSHPAYVAAVQEQVSRLGFYSNSVVNTLQQTLADKLGKASRYDDYALFLVNSGAEANENALKLASFHNGKRRVVCFHRAFHGRTAAATRVTDNPALSAPITEGFPVARLPLNDADAVETELQKGDVTAVIIEGIQGVGGIRLPSDAFLRQLSELCARYDACLILDEIQSGYGRSGCFFAHQYAGIRPDLITVAKGIANGFPVGAVLISPAFQPVKGRLGTTFGGNHLACAAAIAVLDIMEKERLIDNARRVGDYLLQELRALPGVSDVRGRGLMIGVEVEQPVADLRRRLLFDYKVFTGFSAPHTLRLLPPLCLSMTDAADALQRLAHALAS